MAHEPEAKASKETITVENQSQLEETASHQKEFTVQTSFAVAGAFFSTFTTAGFTNAFGVFQEYYRTHQLRSKSDFEIIWIASFQSFILFVFAPVAGVMVDRIGPFVPLCIGSAGLLIGVFMTSLCTQYYQFFLAQGLLVGAGMSFLTIPSLAAVSRGFVRHRGLAMGIMIAGSSIGGVVWPIEVNNLLNTNHLSFGWTMRVVGFTMLPLCIFVILTVRAQSQRKHTATVVTVKASDPKGGLSILKNPSFVLLCGGMAVLFFGFFTPLFFITSYGVDLGLSTKFSFYLPAIVNAASFFGRTIPGFLADRYGPFNILLISALASGIVAFCWTAASSVAGVVVWTLAYGFASGSFLSLQSTCAAKLTTPETYGTAVGLVMGSAALTGLFGPPIAGELLPKGYLALSSYSGATLLAGTLLIAIARFKQDKRFFVLV